MMMNDDDREEPWLVLSSSDEDDEGNSTTLDLETATTCIPGKDVDKMKAHSYNIFLSIFIFTRTE